MIFKCDFLRKAKFYARHWNSPSLLIGNVNAMSYNIKHFIQSLLNVERVYTCAENYSKPQVNRNSKGIFQIIVGSK